MLSSTSARTLILGIDKEGRVRQHDRVAGDVLAESPGTLIGTELATVLAVRDGAAAATLQNLIDSAISDRESTAMLSFRTANGQIADAVVTVQPIRSEDPELAAQVIMRIAPPASERFLDPAVMRHIMLEGAVRRIGGALDIDQMAPELMSILVPHFCNAGELLVLESLVGDDEFPSESPDASHLVRRLALAHDDQNGGWDAAFPTGEILRYPPNTPYTRCMDSGSPVCELMSRENADKTRRRLATPAGGGAAVRRVDAAAAAGLPRRHAGLLRLRPARRVPPVRRLRHRDRDGVRRPGRDLHGQRPAV